jgi:hypothetical protein
VSVHVSSWAWKQEIGDDGAKLVLLKLADSANDDGVAWPKRETLQSECEAGHEDTIKRRLRKLRDLGLIISVPWNDANGRQTSSMYVLPHRGIPSPERLWQIVENANRKGSHGLDLAALMAAEAVGSFLRGGASVHPLNFGSGGASTHPSGGAPAHPSIEEPSVEPSTEELRSSGKQADQRLQIELALTVALGVRAGTMTASEKTTWGRFVDELVEVGATGDDVAARCAAYRDRWPQLVLTAKALVNNWSSLGAHAEVKTAGFDAWIERAPDLFDRVTAHEIVADTPGLEEPERSRRHALVDQRFNARREDAA